MRPLALTERARVVQVVLDADGNDTAFRIFSRATEDDDFTLHASGRVARLAQYEDSRPQRVIGSAIDGVRFYSDLRALGIEFSTELLTSVERGDGWARGRVHATHGAGSRALALDAVMQTGAAALLAQAGSQGFAQAAIDRLDILAPLSGTLIAEAHRNGATTSVEICAMAGDSPVLRISGLMFRPMTTALPASSVYEVNWLTIDAPPPSASRRRWIVIADDARLAKATVDCLEAQGDACLTTATPESAAAYDALFDSAAATFDVDADA